MPNNPIHDEQLAELDRLQHDTTPRPWLYGKVWLDHVPNYMAVIALHNAYPALRQRLLDAESRLAEAENALARAHGIAARQLSEPADISDSIALVRICTEIEAAKRLREGKDV